MLDARLLQVKLKKLEGEKVMVKTKKGKKYWKLK
jgi:small nuclear ribonucleoprotein (snRNP)-like protein